MTTASTYDFLNRLQNITSTPSASGESAVAFNYAYNDANQRVRVNMADGSFWIYDYDKLGQVVSGKRYWSDWTPVAGQQYEYAFDDIGNRGSTKSGGDSGGAALRAAAYSANSLNQYTSRDVPAYLNVLGIAHANASVTVNSQSPYRRGEYYWKELSVDNSSATIWQSVTNKAVLAGTTNTVTGNLFLTKSPEDSFITYDADGNLTSDGRWTNKWDAENRLIDMTSHSSGPSGSRKSLQFAYDAQGRRYSKVVSNWTGSAWTRALHELYLYDGWNLLGALDGTNNSIVRSFLWGLDLSGSLQGAGGVGGLICFKQHSGSLTGTHFAAYDGNGNVMALVDGKTGSTSARYEYDPFGQAIRASGTMALLNPVRFSSKPVDDETDLAYYGYRYLNPNTGRWLNRDLIEEKVDPNLFLFSKNASPNSIDSLGLFSLFITLHFDAPRNTMPPGHQDYPGVTGYQLFALEQGSWVTCAPACKKRVGTQMALTIETWFRQGANLNMVNDAGHTLLEHENGHGDIAISHLAEPVDADLDRLLNKCLKAACADALYSWFTTRIEEHAAATNLAQYDYDGSEFALTTYTWWQTGRLPLMANLIATAASSLAAGFEVINQCGGSNPSSQ